MAKNNLKNFSVGCLVGPTTALIICKGKVISGCGNELSVFDLSTNEIEARTSVFTGTSIHGFREGQGDSGQILLCVFGAKQACVVSIGLKQQNVVDSITFKSHILTANDWIWDAHWILEEDGSSCISLALAHNSALLWDWNSQEIKQTQGCVEKCILYSACLVGNTWKDLIFMAGTVFNKIVLWPVGDAANQTSNDHPRCQEPVDVMHTFAGHKGVIFSIQYHTELKRLCSVSDDRSIRMWQLTFPENGHEHPSVANWRQMESHLMFFLYGHAARVWSVVLMLDRFASVGEDATCCLWNYKGNILHKFKGHKGKSIWSLAAAEDDKYVATGGGDASIRVWELQQSECSQATSVIPLYLLEKKNDFPRTVQMLEFDTILIMMNSGSLYKFNLSNQEFDLVFSDPKFFSYSVISPCPKQHLCAVGSIFGDIRVIDVRGKLNTKQADVTVFKGKVLCIVWVDDSHLLCSGPNGKCLLLKIADECDQENTKHLSATLLQILNLPVSKHRWISGACCLGSLSNNADDTFLVCGDKDGSVFFYPFVHKREETAGSTGVEPLQSFHRIHGKTGVTFVCERKGMIYTTGRDGFLREWRVQHGVLVQLHGHKVLKGLDWIVHLTWDNDDMQVYGFFSSSFVVWSVSYNQQLVSVHCGGGHRSWGFWSQGDSSRFIYLKNGEVCVVSCGSQGKQFLLHPVLHGREVCDVKFVPTQKSDDSPVICSASEDTFINVGTFTKTGSLTVWRPLAILKGHLSSVRALSICSRASARTESTDLNQLSPKSSSVLFSGGGRAEICAWRVSISNFLEKKASYDTDKADNILSQSSSQSVDTGTTDVATAEQKDSLFASSNSMDRNKEVLKNQWLCQHEHLCTYFLGESRHKQRFSSWKAKDLKLDPETRVMSISSSSVHDLVMLNERNSIKEEHVSTTSADTSVDMDQLSHLYILSVAGSDGHLRILSFDEKTRQFQTIGTTFHHKCCVLKALHYVHHAGQNEKISLTLSASTSGDIVLWNLSGLVLEHLTNLTKRIAYKLKEESTDEEVEESLNSIRMEEMETIGRKQELEPMLSLKAHQSGINSLHVLQVSESKALVASGGDDNAITVHMLYVFGLQVSAVAMGTKLNAHAAQITGIWVISPSLIVSTSIDQRVCVWQLTYKEDVIELCMIACKYINITDISCMDVVKERNSVHLCIAGEGICLLHLDLNNED